MITITGHLNRHTFTHAAVALGAVLLTACSTAERLANIGAEPPLSAIDNPTSQPGYKPVRMPMPAPAAGPRRDTRRTQPL